MAKSKLKYGKKDLIQEGDLDPKKAKVRISLYVDGDVLLAFKDMAKLTSHGEYQTLMREKLREAVFGKQIDPELEEMMRQIAREEIRKKAG